MQTRTILTTALAGLAAMASTAAAAQAQPSQPTPPSIRNGDVVRSTSAELKSMREFEALVRSKDARLEPDRDTDKSMAVYGEVVRVASCMARTDAGAVRLALAHAPASKKESTGFAANYRKIADCGKQYTTLLSLQRGSLSEALYLAEHTAPLSGTNGPAAGAVDFVKAENEWNKGREANDQMMIGATNCLVALNPAAVDAVVRSVHGSAQELAAMQAAFAGAPACAGGTVPANLSRSFLRAFMADSLYRASAGASPLGVFKG